jgi:hypothetical protein
LQAKRYIASQDVVACQMDGVLALLDLNKSLYFTLNVVGGVVWESLAQETSIETITSVITDRFDVDVDTALKDVTSLLSRLESSGLVHVVE